MSRTIRLTIAAGLPVVAASALVALCTLVPRPAHAVGDAFTYQGQLKKNGVPYTGDADFFFQLYDDPTNGNLIASANQFALPVTDGLFTASIDFGAGAFDGNPRWLQILTETAGEGFETLVPRQEIRSVPYAVRSGFSESGGAGAWSIGTTGIYYLGGNVAIGQSSDANPDRRFAVNTGTANENPVWLKNNNANYATFAVQNDAVNGIGIYDAWSDRHYIAGNLGLGVLNPVSPLHASTATAAAAVLGEYTGAFGTSNAGVLGVNNAFDTGASGVKGTSLFGAGVRGESAGGHGVYGTTNNAFMAGGTFANTAGGPALLADGLAQVKTLQILGGADLVEGFDTRGATASEPGTVVVIDERNAGGLRASDAAYDRKVAGVVSGAGGIAAGIRLGQNGTLGGETLVAMTGRVYVKCSCENGVIRPGDLLTTSSTAGHAMRATDHDRANGAVIGKAMSSLGSGTGLVLALVNLQ